MASSAVRQKWLEDAMQEFRIIFFTKGYTVPEKVRISIGFPRGMHGGKKAIGQCWSHKASSDGYYEIFASPELGNDGKPKPSATADMLETVAHEMVHATVGTECGHKGAFRICAMTVGFEGPMTHTPAGPGMKAHIAAIVAKLGEYPAGALNAAMRKKQGTRLIKCQCDECDYTARVTRKWIAEAGTPICPTDEVPLRCV
jgi:hypothetical protein